MRKLREVDFFAGLLDLSEFSQRLPNLSSSRQSAFCWQAATLKLLRSAPQVVARMVRQPVLAAPGQQMRSQMGFVSRWEHRGL